MGRRKRYGNHSPPKINSYRIQRKMKKMDIQFQTPNKPKTDYPKEPNKAHKSTLKEEILQEITENFMEILLDKVKKMYRRHSRNSKTIKIKNMRRHKNK
jgi:hypothetical protein